MLRVSLLYFDILDKFFWYFLQIIINRQISKISNNNRAKRSVTTNPTIHPTSRLLFIEITVVGEQENVVVFVVEVERGNEESRVGVNFELVKSAHLTVGVLSRTTDGQGDTPW